MNQIYLIGRSGADAELKYTPNGTAVCNLSIATSEKRGETYETTWHRVNIFGKTAEAIGLRIKKGSEVFIQGKLTSRTWDDKNTGQKRTSVEILANWVRLIDRGAPQGGESPPPSNQGPQFGQGYMDENDIPF
jgi:single-strand DNA-binding protein